MRIPPGILGWGKDYSLCGKKQSGKLSKQRLKYYENNLLFSDLITHFKNYMDDFPQETIIEGYSSSYVSDKIDDKNARFVKGTPYRTIMTRYVNNKGDIIKYLSNSEDIDQSSEDSKYKIIFPRIYECEYNYNERNEWTEAILSTPSKFLILREITYLREK